MSLRQPDHPIAPLFVRRWSPRAMSGAPLPHGEVLRLLEAARWAPSSGNGQPWRFVVAHRDGPAFGPLHAALADGNQPWAARAAALIVVCGVTHRENGKPARLYAFDVGAAWMALALQGTELGVVVHAMEGFDTEKVRAIVRAPDGVEPLCVVAVGLPGDRDLLEESARGREHPNQRRPLAESVVTDAFAKTP
jgi:nitroreductase